MNRNVVLTCVLMAFAITGSACAEDPAPTIRVLFVGNSYTYVNDLPGMLSAMSDASGDCPVIKTVSHVRGGCTFRRHVEETGAMNQIAQGEWDYVVLQDQSQSPILSRTDMLKYGRQLAGAVDDAGARPLLFMTWARQHLPEMQRGIAADPSRNEAENELALECYAREFYDDINSKRKSDDAKAISFDDWYATLHDELSDGLTGGYRRLAKTTGARIAPVGLAWWEHALSEYPDVELHSKDKSHPSLTGTYLSACVFYATVTGESPVGLPCKLRDGLKTIVAIDPDLARHLQTIAWKTVQNEQQ